MRIQPTILSRSPSARSSCYDVMPSYANNNQQQLLLDIRKMPTTTDVTFHRHSQRRPSFNVQVQPTTTTTISHQSSLEESGIFSKSSSTTEDYSSINACSVYKINCYNEYEIGQGQGRGQGQVQDLYNQPSMMNQQTLKPCGDHTGNRTNYSPAKSTGDATLIKASSTDDVTISSSAIKLDLRVSSSLESNASVASPATTQLSSYQSDQIGQYGQTLEIRKQKINTVLQKTIEILASEIDTTSIAEYLQKTRPELDLAAVDWNEVNSSAEDLFWDILTGQEHENYSIFCDVIGSKDHLHHIVDLLQTLDSLIALVSPVLVEDDVIDLTDENYFVGECVDGDTCRGAANLNESSDFDIDLIYCHSDTNPVNGDCSSISLSGAGYLPSVTDDELGQGKTPMLSVNLINYCLCTAVRASNLKHALKQSCCIRELSLVKNHLSQEDQNLLFKAIRTNLSLVKLDLRMTCINNDAAAYLGVSLRSNSTLRLLNIASTGLSEVGCVKLAAGLVCNRTLSELDIGFNDIRDIGCKSIAETLSRANPLRKVRMRDNGITCSGARELFQSLARNSRLSFLDISSNGIGNESLRHLSEALISNRTLRELNLENCRISYDGCIGLARALRANTALRCLQLSLNPIMDRGLEALSDGLKYNHALEVLSINMCNISNTGFLRLLEALRFNFTLKTAKLCYNNIGSNINSSSSSSYSPRQNGVVTSVSDHQPPSIDEIYARLCEILHYNPKLKMLLWGNDLDSASSPKDLAADDVRRCQKNRPEVNSSSFYGPMLGLFQENTFLLL